MYRKEFRNGSETRYQKKRKSRDKRGETYPEQGNPPALRRMHGVSIRSHKDLFITPLSSLPVQAGKSIPEAVLNFGARPCFLRGFWRHNRRSARGEGVDIGGETINDFTGKKARLLDLATR
jgi:hypothetical protein